MNTTTESAPVKEKIALILHKGKNLNERLGISEDRAEEICGDILEEAWGSKDPVEKRMAKVAALTTNHNELAWAMFALGCHISEAGSNPIASLMLALGKN